MAPSVISFRTIWFAILIPVTFAGASCKYIGGKRVRGNGNLKTEDRQVGSFAGIKSSGSFDVYLSTGESQAVKIDAEDNLLQYIETKIEDNVLHISTRDGYWIRPKREVRVFITSPSFPMVRLYGSGDIISQTPISDPKEIQLSISGSGDMRVEVNAPSVKSELAGSGTINVSGQARLFVGEVSGSGDIKARDLKTEETKVDIAGSGSAEVFASVKLDVDVKGSGDVKYRGNPHVTSDIKGSGSVRKID